MNACGGMYITGQTATLGLPLAGVKLTSTNAGWVAQATNGYGGDGSVTVSITSGRLTLIPGLYLVTLNLTIEGEQTSGAGAVSGDAVGTVSFKLYKGGSAVTGAVVKSATMADAEVMHVSLTIPVQITQASQDAATAENYIEVYGFGGDANGNNVIISEGQFTAVRIG